MAEKNNRNAEEDAQPERQPLDPLVYAQTVIAGIIHPTLSREQRVANYIYLSRFAIDFPGLEPLVEEIHTSWETMHDLPSLAFLRTRHSQFDEFLVMACQRLSDFGEGGTLPSHMDYARLVDDYVEAWEKRNTRSILAHAADLAGESPEAAMTYIEENLKPVESSRVPLDSLSFKEIYETDINRGRIFPAHLRPLDAKIGNFRLGTTSIIAGFRSHFKTTLACNILYNAVVRYGFHCCFLSLEMSKEELMLRLMVRHAQNAKFGDRCRNVTLKRVQRGMLTDEEKQFLFNEVEADWKACTSGKLEILASIDFPRITQSEVFKKLQQVERQLGGHLHAIFVDYIQLFGKVGEMERGRAARSMFESTGIWARWFQQLARKFNAQGIHCCLLAQTSGDAYKEAEKNGGRYDSSRNVGESKEIEDAADYLVTIFCGEEEKNQRCARLQLPKNRHGEAIYTPENVAIDPERFIIQDWQRSEELDAYTVDIM